MLLNEAALMTSLNLSIIYWFFFIFGLCAEPAHTLATGNKVLEPVIYSLEQKNSELLEELLTFLLASVKEVPCT